MADSLTRQFEPRSDITEGILDALHWCRLGRVRPKDTADFYRARDLGLLAQDPIWRTTIDGDLTLASLRAEAYGGRMFAIHCSFCGAKPLQPCVVPSTGRRFNPRDKYRLAHAARERAGEAPGWGA